MTDNRRKGVPATFAALKEDYDDLRVERDALLQERNRLREALAKAAIPHEALLIDVESRKWIAPEIWTAIEVAVKADEQVRADSPQGQTQEAELKPCPFDGRVPALKKIPTRSLNPKDDYWIIACEVFANGGEPLVDDGCGIYQQGRTREEVIRRWNSRADLPRATASEIPARLAQIKERFCNTANESATYRVRINDLAWLINEVELRTPRATEGELTVEAAQEAAQELRSKGLLRPDYNKTGSEDFVASDVAVVISKHFSAGS